METGASGAFSGPPHAVTLYEILRWRAIHQPDQLAYAFLTDGETDATHLTYAALDRRAQAIAARIQDQGGSGERVLLLFPPGLEYIAAFFGCLYAGAVAVPAYPPHSVRLDGRFHRLWAVALDAQPVVALTTSSILSAVRTLTVQEPNFPYMRWLATDHNTEGTKLPWYEPAASGDALALLQYTSGSTATPKGVMLTHGNLLHNLAIIHACCEHTALRSRGMTWAPPYHDMGLIGGILQPLYGGFPITLMSPVAFLQQPIRWLRAISRTRATTSGGPNFAYDLCVRKIAPEQCASLDLTCWSVAFNSAEPIRHETLEQFAAAFAPCGFRAEAFYPCYGLAEATLLVAGGPKQALPVIRTFAAATLEHNHVAAAPAAGEESLTLVGCGQALGSQQIAIVDPDTLIRCPSGHVGEIWVSGPSIASGYWNRPDETQNSFQAFLTDNSEGPFLRTGDLGFLQNGELFITGRLKDLIIIGGRNIYPEDIERTVQQSHSSLRPGGGGVFSVEVSGEERLVIVQEVERKFHRSPLDEVTRAIRRAVMEQHDVQVYRVLLLKPGRIPKTSSGKIQRHACRDGFLAGSLDVVQDE